jgi:uroporphyrinogen-III synthase
VQGGERHPGMQALVTRPREEAGSLAVALAARGVGAIIEPMLEVQFNSARSPDLTRIQAVLCTSANGVRALARLTDQRGLPLFAVGDATASRARAEGFAMVESAGGTVVDLARLAAEKLRPQDGPLLHVAGDVVAGDLAGALRAQGFTIERSVLYETRPVAMLTETAVDALRAGSIDFALFFSPRTAAIFVELAGSAAVAQCCRSITALSISAAADAPLAALAWGERRIAEMPNQRALLALLDQTPAERRRAQR